MKRVISVLLVMVLCVGLCGCDNAQEPANDVVDTSVQTVIDLVSVLPVGTMGVTLKAIESAVTLMQWCEVTSLTADQVAAQLSSYCMDLDNTAYFTFYEQVHLLTTTASAWQDPERMASDFRMVGLDPKDYSWDAHAFEILEAVTMGCEVIFD